MRIALVASLFAVGTFVAACSSAPSPSPSSPSPASDALAPFVGSWTSTAPSGASLAQSCQNVTYVVTPTGTNTASVTYSATCSGVPISGTGSGTAHGSTLDWIAAGTAGICPFSLSGTATPQAPNLNVTYAGTVCGAPVSGSTVLHQ